MTQTKENLCVWKCDQDAILDDEKNHPIEQKLENLLNQQCRYGNNKCFELISRSWVVEFRGGEVSKDMN